MLDVDPRTSASLPGQINADMMRLFKLRPWYIIPPIIGIILIVIGLTVVKNPRVSYVGGPIGIFTPILAARQTMAKFKSGCLLPGCIISVEPLLVASVTDLATGRSPKVFTALAITSPPAAAFPNRGRNLKVGDPCPVCALYHGNLKSERWNSFDPEPVWVATSDPAIVAQAEAQLSESDWQELSTALNQVPHPVKRGTYRVSLGANSGWPANQIGKKL